MKTGNKPARKLNNIARKRSSGDRSRKSVPKAGPSVSGRDESGVKPKPKPKWNIRR